MSSSHITKPAADILSDFVDAVMSAYDGHQVRKAREQALLEFRCSWGLSEGEASPLLSAAVTIATMTPEEQQVLRQILSSRKEPVGAHAPQPTPAANFV